MKAQNEENWYRLYLLSYNGFKPNIKMLEEGEILAVTYGKIDWEAGRNPSKWEKLQVRIIQDLE